MNTATRFLSLCLVAAIGTSLGCKDKQSYERLVLYASPHEAFSNMQAAANAKDWQRFCECFTEGRLAKFAGDLWLQGTETVGILGVDDGMRKRLKSALEGSGVTKEDFDNSFATDFQCYYLGCRVKDLQAFIAAMMSVVEEMKAKDGSQAPSGIKIPEGQLGEVFIDGKKAIAVCKTKDGKETKINFIKADGGWLVHWYHAMNVSE